MYQIIDIGNEVVPDFVMRSNKYRYLRAAIAEAEFEKPVVIKIDDQTESGINAMRNACYSFSGLDGTPDCVVKTRTFRPLDASDSLKRILEQNGVEENDRVMVAFKLRV